MRIIISNYVTIENPTADIKQFSTKALTLENQQYHKNKEMGISNFATPRNLYYYHYNEDTDTLRVPTGFWMEHFHYIKPDEDTRFDRLSSNIKQLTFNGELRDYQLEASRVMQKYTNGILESPTGSGKTVIAMNMIKEMERPTLFLVHTIDLSIQFIQACEKFLGFKPGLIGSGKFEVRDISVCILQTLISLDDEKFRILNDTYSYVIGDEVHKLGADQYFSAVGRLNAKYKHGLSATPKREDGKTDVIKFATGPIRHAIHLETVKENLHFPDFEYIETEFDFPIFSSREMELMLQFMGNDPYRNKLIVDARNKYTDKKCVILCKRVKHMELLKTYFPDSEIIEAKTNRKKRIDIMERFKAGKLRTLISSYKILGTGIDDAGLDMLIMANPTSNEIDIKQTIGRVMRPKSGKAAIIVDLVDKKIGRVMNMAKKRQRLYKKYIKLAEEQNGR